MCGFNVEMERSEKSERGRIDKCNVILTEC
jgi:hypothetical protein